MRDLWQNRVGIVTACMLALGIVSMPARAAAQAPPMDAAPATEPATKPASIPVDQNTPRGTMKMFISAITVADADMIHKLFLTSNEIEQITIDAVVSSAKANKDFRDALIKSFGAEQASTLVGNPEKDLPRGMEMIDASAEQIDGDRASVDTREGEGSEPIKLKKIDGKWQLDAAAFVRDRDPVVAHQHIDDMNFASGLMSKFAGDIAAGKFKTVDEAKEQIQLQMMAAFQQRAAQKMAPPASGPSAAPATQPEK